MKTETKKLTPAVAKELLARNTRNRPVKDRHVMRLAMMMKNGEWKLTHQGIAISETGEILDGQHRLLACVKSNCSIPILVTTGIPNNSMSVIDTGVKRGVKDAFALLEVKYSTIIPAILRNYLNLKEALQLTDLPPQYDHSSDYYYQLYLENEKVINDAVVLSKRCYQKNKTFSQTEVGGLATYLKLERGHSWSKITSFFNMVYLFDTNQTPATSALTNVLFQNLRKGEKMGLRYKRMLIIRAWNAYLSSANVSRFNIHIDAETPKIL